MSMIRQNKVKSKYRGEEEETQEGITLLGFSLDERGIIKH